MNTVAPAVVSSHRWALRRAARSVLCRDSLVDFARFVWPILEPATPLVWGWHMDAICQWLTDMHHRRRRRVVINVPPGTAKTFLAQKAFTPWVWLHNPSERFMCVMNDASLANDVNQDARTVVESERYRMLLDELGREWTVKRDRNRVERFDTSEEGYRASFGLNTTFLGFRGSFQVLDDPHKQLPPNPSAAKRQLATDNHRVFKSLATRVNDKRNTPRAMIMQRLAQGDASERAIRAGWDVLCLPMEFNPDHPHRWPDDPRTQRGELLFPARFDRAAIDEAKAELGSDYPAQYNQLPAPPEGGPIQRAWFEKRYPDPPDVQARSCASMVITVDPAGIEEHVGEDYTVMQVWGRVGDFLFMLDQRRGRWGIGEAFRQFRDLCAKWPKAGTRLIERTVNGLALTRRCDEARIAYTPVHTAGKDKHTRAADFLWAAEGGRIRLPEERHAPWVDEFVDELCAFQIDPTAHDDQLDAAAYAATHLLNRKLQAVTFGGIRGLQ